MSCSFERQMQGFCNLAKLPDSGSGGITSNESWKALAVYAQRMQVLGTKSPKSIYMHIFGIESVMYHNLTMQFNVSFVL